MIPRGNAHLQKPALQTKAIENTTKPNKRNQTQQTHKKTHNKTHKATPQEQEKEKTTKPKKTNETQQTNNKKRHKRHKAKAQEQEANGKEEGRVVDLRDRGLHKTPSKLCVNA